SCSHDIADRDRRNEVDTHAHGAQRRRRVGAERGGITKREVRKRAEHPAMGLSARVRMPFLDPCRKRKPIAVSPEMEWARGIAERRCPRPTGKPCWEIVGVPFRQGTQAS